MTIFSRLFFDREDDQLLELVRNVLTGDTASLDPLLSRNLHPRGIKELAASRGLRMAGATARLSESFSSGGSEERIAALRSLRDEVLLSGGSNRHNTARVLIQIMKEIVARMRSGRTDTTTLLRLAHDFRLATTGKTRLIRKELIRRHLLEMPEEWNQYAFDHHVHDASSKGRKNPSQLLLDASLKGIRQLTVVYYNTLVPAVIEELLTAGRILDMEIQVAIEFAVPFRDRYARITWEPRGFEDKNVVLRFLQNKAVRQLLDDGNEVVRWKEKYVFAVLDAFNDTHRHELGKQAGCEIPPCDRTEFLKFVGPGQPGLIHLASFIRATLPPGCDISLQKIIDSCLLPKCNPQLPDPGDPHSSDASRPALLRTPLPGLLARLRHLQPTSGFTLNLANLSPQDMLELLYLSGGGITHIEAWNLKNYGQFSANRPGACSRELNDEASERCLRHFFTLAGNLQRALSRDNAIALKQVVRDIIDDYTASLHKKEQEVLATKTGQEELLEMKQRSLDLLDILHNLQKFRNFYSGHLLGSRIGSSSTGRAADHFRGMGLVVIDTLPRRVQREVRRECREGKRSLTPTRATLIRNHHTITRQKGRKGKSWTDWSLTEIRLNFTDSGNITTLGGIGAEHDHPAPWYRYLNSHLKNVLKITIGFIPAMLTFMLTKDWWLLAWFGAPLWFTITGLRNIIQSVLGGGGLRRSPLLPWNSFISWSRVSDSLLFTGFSVPLLDWLVKTVFLDHGMGVNTTTNPLLLYAVMGMANGIYIFSHNIIRGLPTIAATGNIFRSILSIPVAVAINGSVAALLASLGVPGIDGILQRWAAIISKFASDCVAAVIEGLADRRSNTNTSLDIFRSKFNRIFSLYADLELLMPDTRLPTLLDNPELCEAELRRTSPRDLRHLIVNALDIMYFRFYLPRGVRALHELRREMSPEECAILDRSQLILSRWQEISRLLVSGSIGAHFDKMLSFYLNNRQSYLREIPLHVQESGETSGETSPARQYHNESRRL